MTTATINPIDNSLGHTDDMAADLNRRLELLLRTGCLLMECAADRSDPCAPYLRKR